MYRVYVIQNTRGQRYIGLSEDVEKRLNDHNGGVSTYTRSRGPWQLIWTSEPMDLGRARRLENQLKRSKGGVQFYAITGLPRPGS